MTYASGQVAEGDWQDGVLVTRDAENPATAPVAVEGGSEEEAGEAASDN